MERTAGDEERSAAQGEEVAERRWWGTIKKAAFVTGTYDDAAFQLHLQVRDGDANAPPSGGVQETLASTEAEVEEAGEGGVRNEQGEAMRSSDPIGIKLFDVLGYHCVPHCGVYSHDNYEPALPFVLLSLPFSLLMDAMRRNPDLLPRRMYDEMTGPAAQYFSIPDSSFYMMVHPCPGMKECQHFMCDSRREVNVITHAWTFPDVDFTPSLEVETDVDLGLFGPSGVEETHMNLPDSRFNGLPFNRMERRMVIIHWQSFSPLNAQIRFSDTFPSHSFFLISRHWYTSRQCVSFHIIVEDNELFERLHKEVGKMATLGELVDGLRCFGEGGDDVNEWKYNPFKAFSRIIEGCLNSAAVHAPDKGPGVPPTSSEPS